MNQSHWVRIGKLARKHGIKGHLVLIPDASNRHFLEKGILFIEIDGIKVPFFIEEYRVFNPKEILLRFEDYHDPDKAARLIGRHAWIEREEKPAERPQFRLEDLNGFMIVDADRGKIGPILETIELSGNHLFRTEHKGKELLLPAVEAMIQAIDIQDAVVHMRLPEGLLDLNNRKE